MVSSLAGTHMLDTTHLNINTCLPDHTSASEAAAKSI